MKELYNQRKNTHFATAQRNILYQEIGVMIMNVTKHYDKAPCFKAVCSAVYVMQNCCSAKKNKLFCFHIYVSIIVGVRQVM